MDVLKHKLRLRFDEISGREPERIAALNRGGDPLAHGSEFWQAAMGRAVDVIERALEDSVGVPADGSEMRPVAAEAVGGEIAVARSAVKVADTAAVSADREVSTGVVAAAIGTVVSIEVEARLQPEESVVEMRAG